MAARVRTTRAPGRRAAIVRSADVDDRDVLNRDRGSDVDQSIADVGEGEAKVADLGRVVRHRLGFVICPKQLGERQRNCEKSRLKPRVQGRCAHAMHPVVPSWLETYGILYPLTSMHRGYSDTGPQPDLPVCRGSIGCRPTGIEHPIPGPWLPDFYWIRARTPTVVR